MMNERCLLIDEKDIMSNWYFNNKNIKNDFGENSIHKCLYKLKDSILLIWKDNCDIP